MTSSAPTSPPSASRTPGNPAIPGSSRNWSRSPRRSPSPARSSRSSASTATGSAAASTTATRASPLRILETDPDVAVDAAWFARKIADAVSPAPRGAEARRRQRRLARGAQRRRRPVAAWSSTATPTCWWSSSSAPACSATANGSTTRSGSSSPAAASTASPTSTCRSRRASTSAAPSRRRRQSSPSTACSSAPIRPARTRPASSPTSATTANGCRTGAPASACSTCAATPAASACTRRCAAPSEVVGVDIDEDVLDIAKGNAQAQRRAPALRAGRHLPLAARCGNARRAVRRGDPRPGQDDPRPRAGDPGAEEIPRHEQARARRGAAGRPARHVLVHRPGQRGAVPRHAAPRGVLRQPHDPGAEGRRAPAPTIRFWRSVQESRYLKAVFCRVLD